MWRALTCHRFPLGTKGKSCDKSQHSKKSMQLKIVTLPGDGVGPEVTEQAVLVLREIANIHGHNFQFAEHDAGGVAIKRWGSPLPTATLDAGVLADPALSGRVGCAGLETLN